MRRRQCGQPVALQVKRAQLGQTGENPVGQRVNWLSSSAKSADGPYLRMCRPAGRRSRFLEFQVAAGWTVRGTGCPGVGSGGLYCRLSICRFANPSNNPAAASSTGCCRNIARGGSPILRTTPQAASSTGYCRNTARGGSPGLRRSFRQRCQPIVGKVEPPQVRQPFERIPP